MISRSPSVNGPLIDVRFGMEITLPDRPPVEGVDKNPLERVHRGRVRIDRQRPIAQIAEPAAIVQAHDVVGVRVRENHRVEPVDFFAQALHAELRRRVHDELDFVRRDVNRGAGAPVLRVGQEFRRILLADDAARPATCRCPEK